MKLSISSGIIHRKLFFISFEIFGLIVANIRRKFPVTN